MVFIFEIHMVLLLFG